MSRAASKYWWFLRLLSVLYFVMNPLKEVYFAYLIFLNVLSSANIYFFCIGYYTFYILINRVSFILDTRGSMNLFVVIVPSYSMDASLLMFSSFTLGDNVYDCQGVKSVSFVSIKLPKINFFLINYLFIYFLQYSTVLLYCM